MTNSVEIAEIISRRWSPRAFDPAKPVEPSKLMSVFEAARWAPSSGNGQPWCFIVGYNFNKSYQDILSTLNDSNQIWAKNAPVLLITVAKAIRNDRPNRFAFHDVGLATENLFLQACELGLSCHFMGGFSPDKVRDIFGIPDDHEAVAAGAIGYMGEIDSLPDDLKEREAAARQRKPIEEFVFSGKWNNPLGLSRD